MGGLSTGVDVARSEASGVSWDLLDTPDPGVEVRGQNGILTGKAWIENSNPGLTGIQQEAWSVNLISVLW